jgi:TPR repeat protein
MVRGQVVPSSRWTTIHENIEITGLGVGVLFCRSFTEGDAVVGSAAAGGSKRGATTGVVRNVKTYKETFALANYPGAEKLTVGYVIRGGIAAVAVGEVRGLTLYDYGVPYTPPAHKLTAQEVAAANANAAKKKTETDAAKLKFQQQQADDGKATYQYQMGMRFLHGDGVTQDRTKALDYLSKAAAQGNEDAKTALANFSKLASQSETTASTAQPEGH